MKRDNRALTKKYEMGFKYEELAIRNHRVDETKVIELKR